MRDMQGSTFARFDYDAHGNIRAEEVLETDLIDEETAQIITDLQPLRYAGYVWDAEIQLYYCSQRYYDPAIGAFISKDPIKADGELSFYAYCTGDPINRIDPSGLDYIARQMAANRAAQQRAHWQAYQRAMTQRYPMAALRSAENRVRNGWATSSGSTWSGYSSGKYSPAYIPPPQPCTACHSLIDANGKPVGGSFTIPSGSIEIAVGLSATIVGVAALVTLAPAVGICVGVTGILGGITYLGYGLIKVTGAADKAKHPTALHVTGAVAGVASNYALGARGLLTIPPEVFY